MIYRNYAKLEISISFKSTHAFQKVNYIYPSQNFVDLNFDECNIRYQFVHAYLKYSLMFCALKSVILKRI